MTDEEVIATAVEKAVTQALAAAEEKTAARIADAVQIAVDRTTAEVTERLQANFDTVLDHKEMTYADPTKTDGAVYETDPGTGYAFGFIALEDIDFNPRSKRSAAELKPSADELAPLVQDVEARGGIVRPLLVYRNKKQPGRYVLVKGHRRVAALRALDEELVQAYIMPAKPPAALEEEWVNGF